MRLTQCGAGFSPRGALAPLIAFLSVAAFAQPKFELADIHPSPSQRNRNMQGGLMRGGRYELHQASMVDLILTAYGVEADHVIGGPSWLEADRFEIIAKAPASAGVDQVRPMLQDLLANRFKLVVHRETRPMPAFVLGLGKGKPKLKEADGSGTPGCMPSPPGQRSGPPMIVISCHGVTMAALAESLRDWAGGYINSPVVDTTGIKGTFDVELAWSPRGVFVSGDGTSVFDAIDKQLGLKLEPQKVPTPVVVIDSVNRKPTDNPPGVTTKLPPAKPREFEVAVIKPSDPNATPGGAGFNPSMVDFKDIPLRVLITLAWDFGPGQELFGAPSWLRNDSPRFDVMAKATTEGMRPPNGPRVADGIAFDDLQLMLRALLADRFKMATHYEERPVTAYTLVANKPKLKAADPSNRTKCKSEVLPRREGVPGPPPVQITCLNMSMSEFAGQLQNLAPSYLTYPVLDATSLDGAFDFTFTFTRVNPANAGAGRGGGAKGGRGGAPPPPDGDNASDPTGYPTLFEALNRIGLKLEAQKRPVSVLVIDHLEPKPTEN
jgi:uncharacterized protein (TIGR03435 family)